MATTPGSDPDPHREPMRAFAELAFITVNASRPEQALRRVAELAKQTRRR